MIDRSSNPTTASYLSSFGISAVSLNVNEAVALAGLVLALATFLINWRYKHLHYKLVQKKETNSVAPQTDH